MHGLIHIELKRFVSKTYGAPAWEKLLEQAGLAGKAYDSTHSYPDAESAALIAAAAKVAGRPEPAILEAFGEFVAPGLLAFFPRLINPEWKTLDLVLNTEATIHTVVRTAKAGAAPPELQTVRINAEEVQVTYTSQRKMCALAKGIIKGVATHYQESVVIRETQCMLTGDPACILILRVQS